MKKFNLFLVSLFVSLLFVASTLAQFSPSGSNGVNKHNFVPTEASTTVRYDDGSNENSIGLTGGGIFEVSARFRPALMGPLAGQAVTQVLVYINTGVTAVTVKIYGAGTATTPGTLLYSQSHPVTTVSWNTITLNSAVPVDGLDLWVGYEVNHGASVFPAGLDENGVLDPDGDWIFAAAVGPTWQHLGALGLPGNWNVAAIVESVSGPGPATNPSPANGATNVPITASQATWENPAAAVSNAFYFGTAPGSLTLLQSGSLATSFNIPPGILQYGTAYYWRVNEFSATDTTVGPTWSFTTEQSPLLVQDTLDVYPQNLDYWTGTANTTAKTDVSEVRTLRPELGWMVFDVSAIPASATILSSSFNAYVNANNWPWWSVTPMGSVNPVTADAATIYAQADANTATGVAYVFSNEGATIPLGWINRPMGNTANPDLQAALSQGWFAVGVVDRDVDTYFINFDGWNQPNKPYLTVVYEYIVPVELTSFTAAAVNDKVTLNWSTATEVNNNGFQVERNSGNGFVTVGFVDGKGTTTEVQNYSFTDAGIAAGSYTYRLKQVDFDGSFEYSSEVEVDVLGVREYALNQNFPNPFNPSTMISFSLLVDAKVSLKVFDILGQEVMTIVNNNLSAGAHEYTFDASNFNSGVYFYRIEATGVDGQNFTSVKKMILTK
ncbi:MAG: T9SS type A sorting domain-containing protein [Ignavibacterium sp.]|nr:T9SS type A sorting domain-containing protein [Ignavibacterium sp.]